MALSSYFLVITDHKLPAIRSAGFLYLLIAHLGAIAILLCFGVLHGGQRRLHLRRAARGRALAALGDGRVPARVLRLRRQGGHDPAARLAARGAPGRALAGLGADERRHDQDRHLRHGARDLRPDRQRALGMGHAGAGGRRRHDAVRRALRADAARPEAPARLLTRSRTSASSCSASACRWCSSASATPPPARSA